MTSYPFKERIGDPSLLVGRDQEFAEYGKWIAGMPRNISKSRVIVARKKSGKTAFIQRLFNQLWQDNGSVIPFYIEIRETKIWFPDLAMTYFRTFASQYISFLERDPTLAVTPLQLDEIREYGVSHGIARLVIYANSLENHFQKGLYDSMWYEAIGAPHAFAILYNKPIVVMIDEFQNLSGFVYTDREKTVVDETVPGSYHELSESKVAPMLATGSSVGWLVNVIDRYLEAGRLTKMFFSPYLTKEEGLAAVYRYAEVYQEPISNETALLINQLCQSDPYFIACVIRSHSPGRDLTTPMGVITVVEFETSSEGAELAGGWIVWFNNALRRINERYAKKMLLFLTRNPGKIYTSRTIKKAMNLDMNEDDIFQRLESLREADLVRGHLTDQYIGQDDGTFFLLLQRRLGESLTELDPEADQGIDYLVNKLTGEKRALQNQLNQESGRLAEAQLEIDMRVRGRFHPSTYFSAMPIDPEILIKDVYPRYMVQAPNGKLGEIDLRLDSTDGISLLVEVKKTKAPSGADLIQIFATRVSLFAEQHPDWQVLAGFLSLGGFTEEALVLCQELKIGTAEAINYQHKQWD
jgi:hypothetical protein